MASTFHGSCHCKAIEWDVKLEEDQQKHILCHCDICKKISGGAFTLNQIIPKSNLTFVKGGDKLKHFTYYGDSGKAVNCYFCPDCTAHPYHHQTDAGEDTIVLRTALLDKASELPAAAEIYGKDRISWQKEVASTFSTLPPS